MAKAKTEVKEEVVAEVKAPVVTKEEQFKKNHPGFKAHLFQKQFDTEVVSAKEMEAVEINCDPAININGEKFEGIIVVPRHVARTIVPMIQAKIRADIAIFTGRSYLVERMADRSLVIREGKL